MSGRPRARVYTARLALFDRRLFLWGFHQRHTKSAIGILSTAFRNRGAEIGTRQPGGRVSALPSTALRGPPFTPGVRCPPLFLVRALQRPSPTGGPA